MNLILRLMQVYVCIGYTPALRAITKQNMFQFVLSNSILQKLSNCSNFFSILANRIAKFTVNFSAC